MLSGNTYPVLSFASILQSIAFVYGGTVRLRRWLYQKSVLPTTILPCPVISVGNLTVGGTGKTPMVMHLAAMIGKMGLRAAIVSRGYKGNTYKRSTIVSDGDKLLCDVQQSGDEPYLMATLLSGTPVAVGKDRYAAGKMVIERFTPDLILLDDGFQHLRLHRDLNLLLMDARNPFGNSFVLPRGSLREPISAIAVTDAIVMTRCREPEVAHLDPIVCMAHPKPIFRSDHRVVFRGMAQANRPLPQLTGLSRVPASPKAINGFCFSGLANNDSFFNAMERVGVSVRGSMAFDDHHSYGEADIDHIVKAAVTSGADYLITTDKDFVRLSHRNGFPLALLVAGVALEFPDDAPQWESFITACIKRMMGRRKVGG